MEIKYENIGSISKGCDGTDQYVLLTRRDDELSADQAYEWLLEQVYHPCKQPGGYFCDSVTTIPVPRSTNSMLCIVHHRYDN